MRFNKKIMILLSIVSTAFMLCSCGKPEEKLLGTWSSTFDIAPFIEKALGDEYIEFEAQPINLYLTFQEDGIYQVYADPAMTLSAVSEWEEAVLEYYVQKTYEQMAEEGFSQAQTEELFQKEYKRSCREYMENIISENIDADAFVDLVSISGYYRVTKDSLFLGNPEISENRYDVYTVKNGELILNSPADEPVEKTPLAGEFEYPLVFTRIVE